MKEEAILEIIGITKNYENKKVLTDISLKIYDKEIVSLFGYNGSGKTSLLNIISGLDKPDGGKINFYNKKLSIAYMFQNYRETLFPWKSIRANLVLPLKIKGLSNEEQEDMLDTFLNRYNIKLELNKFPYELSGGQQQLAVLTRTFLNKPDIILLDEPFSALDFRKKIEAHKLILDVWQDLKFTLLWVTHDLDQAILLANRILITKNKKLIEIGVADHIESDFNHILSQSFLKMKEQVLKVIYEDAK